ncbi:hypothetical protein ACFYSC_21565 [Streptosporangium sp. NPDC004379]|uniref:hypothetical protein n=1 Tax=Streptosporangium sp. NPDC004379 TaxID=3366189 RepID=UPI003674A54E
MICFSIVSGGVVAGLDGGGQAVGELVESSGRLLDGVGGAGDVSGDLDGGLHPFDRGGGGAGEEDGGGRRQGGVDVVALGGVPGGVGQVGDLADGRDHADHVQGRMADVRQRQAEQTAVDLDVGDGVAAGEGVMVGGPGGGAEVRPG